MCSHLKYASFIVHAHIERIKSLKIIVKCVLVQFMKKFLFKYMNIPAELFSFIS